MLLVSDFTQPIIAGILSYVYLAIQDRQFLSMYALYNSLEVAGALLFANLSFSWLAPSGFAAVTRNVASDLLCGAIYAAERYFINSKEESIWKNVAFATIIAFLAKALVPVFLASFGGTNIYSVITGEAAEEFVNTSNINYNSSPVPPYVGVPGNALSYNYNNYGMCCW